MKLLLDQNISRRILPNLASVWPGSSQVALLTLDRASDLAIWQYARDHDFVIVTKDADFEELSLLHGSPPKVIWLRLGNTSNSEIEQTLLAHREELDELIRQGGLDCIELHRATVR
jgi:predicted nuclease of predicted toxin-antitoxin system